MQLKKLYIKNHRILKDFTIDFPYDFRKYISVFIGINGSGKSTILEALAQIFSSVVLNEKAKFGFEIEYSVRHEELIEETSTTSESDIEYFMVKLSAKEKGQAIQLQVSNVKNNSIYKGDLLEKDKMKIVLTEKGVKSSSILPNNIIIYYSGLSEILKEICEPHNQILSGEYRKGISTTHNPFFYHEPYHFDIILISLLSYEFGDIPKFLFEKANIVDLENIQLRLKKPSWAKASINEYWGATGTVKSFLEFLNKEAVIEKIKDDLIMITIIGRNSLYKIRDYLREERILFQVLNTMYIDGLLDDIQVSLKKENGKDHKSFSILSEGEKQAITIKGLTELLAEKNTLFLFDEPDTYLHPKWQRQVITEIENTIDSSYNSENSYVIATHSPQLLSNAKSELNFVKIIEDGALVENTPKYYGREISTILYELMGVKERNKTIRKEISNLYTLIEEEEIEDAMKLLKDLQNLIGEDDPELKKAEIQIGYLKEDV